MYIQQDLAEAVWSPQPQCMVFYGSLQAGFTGRTIMLDLDVSYTNFIYAIVYVIISVWGFRGRELCLHSICKVSFYI